MRAPKWPRSRRTIEAERDAAEARALGWQRELLVERAAHGRTRDLVAQSLGILTGPGIKVDVDSLVEVVRAVRRRARLVDGLRKERDGAQAHASHWRREVGALTGVQSEGMADSVLLARLRQVVDDGTRATEVADRARDDEEAAYEAIRRIANALRPGSSGVRVDDVVEWAREASDADSLLASREKLLGQAELFEAELIAIDEALASAGATPAVDRVEAIRTVMDQRDTLGADLVRVDTALGAGEHEHVVGAAERVRLERDTDRAASKALARRVAWLQGDDGGLDRAERVPLAMADGDDAPTELRALARELHRWAPDVDALTVRDRLLALARRLDGSPPEREAAHLAARLAAAAAGPVARRCLCTGRRLGIVACGGVGQSCVVDPCCPVHSPGYRYGGRPVQPLALPPGTGPSGWPHDLPCDHQLIRLTHGGEVVPVARCRWLVGHMGPHGNATGRSWTVEPVLPVDDVVDTTILDALDRWEGDATSGGWVCDACGRPVSFDGPCPEHQPLALADARAEAEQQRVNRSDPWCPDLGPGARCSRPAGHLEPCRPVEPAPSVLVARCSATPHDGGREPCSFVAGHPGVHSWSPELDEVPF